MAVNRRWSAINVRAYLVFQPQPACFSTSQWAEWKRCALAATQGAGDNGGGTIDMPPHCEDCTRQYQTAMRAAGLCAHPEVKFLASRPYLDPGRLSD